MALCPTGALRAREIVAALAKIIDQKIFENYDDEKGEFDVRLSWNFRESLEEVSLKGIIIDGLEFVYMIAGWSKVKVLDRGADFAIYLIK